MTTRSRPKSDGSRKDGRQNTRNAKQKGRVNADLPKTEGGRVDKARVREMFFASPHYEWTKFAESMGWDYQRTRTSVPATLWQEEKRQEALRLQAEKVNLAVFDHQGRYHADVLDTLKNFPKTGDAILALINRKINEITALARIADAPPTDPGQREEWAHSVALYRKMSDPAKLNFLANAYKAVTETKHKSLLLDRWTLKQSEDFGRPPVDGQPQQSKDSTPGMLITPTVEGKPVSLKELQVIVHNYYDAPQLKAPEPPEEVAKDGLPQVTDGEPQETFQLEQNAIDDQNQ